MKDLHIYDVVLILSDVTKVLNYILVHNSNEREPRLFELIGDEDSPDNRKNKLKI